MLDVFLKEEPWLLLATTLGLIAVLALIIRLRRQQLSTRATITSALNLFFGLWIGIMGAGHLFAVTSKSLLGTLPPNIHLWIAIPFGFAIAVPGWWLVASLRALARQENPARKRAMALNGWLGLVLVIPAVPLVVLPAVNLALLAWQGKEKGNK